MVTMLSVLFAYISVNFKKTTQISVQSTKILKHLFSFLSFIPLTFVMAVRFGVGTDYFGYRDIFLSPDQYLDSGFLLLISILKLITSDPQSIFVACAIVICGCNIYMAYKESVNPAASILLFVLCKDYFISMNAMRQYMATAIMLLAIPYMKRLHYLKKSEWFKLILLFLVSFSFHKSAVVFVFLCVINIINIHPLVASCLIAGTYLSSNLIRQALLPLLDILDFYGGYFRSLSYGNQDEKFNMSFMIIFLCFFIMLSCEYYAVKRSKELKFMYSAVIFSLLCISLSAVMPTNIHRLTMHMNCILTLYLPLAVRSFRHHYVGKAVYCAILIAYTSVTLVTIFNGNQDVLPYQTIWH